MVGFVMARQAQTAPSGEPVQEKEPTYLTALQIERRRRILDAVRRQISVSGYSNLSMRDVAAEASIAHATLYNLFETKDGPVITTLRDHLTGILERSGLAGSNAIDRYFRMLSALMNATIENLRYAEAMTRLMFNAPPTDEVTNLLVTQLIAADRRAVRAMITEGILGSDINPHHMVWRLTGA